MLEGVGAECRQSASYYELLGIAYELSGKKDRAEESLQRAAGLDPNSIQLKEQLGATLLRNGKGAKAAAVLEAIAAQTPGVGAKKLLLGAYVESEQWQKAGQLLASEPLEHVEPSDPVFSVWWADTLIHTKQTARLNDELERVAQPLPANLLFSLATLFAKQEMYPEAAKYFSEIPEADADAAVYFNLGLALSHCRRYDEARKNFFLAIDHDPQNTEAYFRVGVDYAASGQARLAVPWLLRMHEMKPERSDIIFALAEQWLNLGYTSSAKQLFAGLSQALRSNPLVECAEADVWRSAGEASKAEGLYRQALAKQSNLTPALVGLARVEREQGKQAAAKADLEKALSIDRESGAANAELGLMAASDREWKQASEYLTRAWAEDQSDAAVALQLARSERNAGKPADALALLSPLGTRLDGSAPYHLELGSVYAQLGQAAKAIAERETASRLQAASPLNLRFDQATTYVQ